jgi:hypothetical protein
MWTLLTVISVFLKALQNYAITCQKRSKFQLHPLCLTPFFADYEITFSTLMFLSELLLRKRELVSSYVVLSLLGQSLRNH